MTHPFTKLVAWAFLILLVLILIPYQYMHHLEPLAVLAYGWVAFPARVLSEVAWEPVPTALAGFGIAIAIAVVHGVVRRFAGADAGRLTAAAVALPLVLLLIGASLSGAITQVRCLSHERWFGYDLDGRLIQRIFRKDLEERLAEDPKYLDDVPLRTVDYADDVCIVIMRRPDGGFGAVALFQRRPAPTEVRWRENGRWSTVTFEEFQVRRREVESGRRATADTPAN